MKPLFASMLALGALVALAALAAAGPAAAHIGGSATIVVPLDHVNPGESFPVIGADLGSDSLVTFRLLAAQRSAELGTATTGPDGHFQANFTLPADFPHGYAELIASADDGSSTSTFVLVGPRTENTPDPPGRAAWWQDPSVIILISAIVVGAALIGVTLLRSRRTERAVVASTRPTRVRKKARRR